MKRDYENIECRIEFVEENETAELRLNTFLKLLEIAEERKEEIA